MENTELSFQYFIASNAPFMVISFVGSWDKECLDKLETCATEVGSHQNIKFVILYFREVPNISLDTIAFLTSFQKRLREKYHLRVCSLKPELKQKLIKMGVVRGLELTDNLQTTLLDLKKMSA